MEKNREKKTFFVSIIFAFVFIFSTMNVTIANEVTTKDEIRIVYNFEQPEISKILIDGQEYDNIKIKGIDSFGNSGEPKIPIKGAYILIPPNTQVSNIIVNYKEKISLGKDFKIVPCGTPTPYSMVDKATKPTPNENIYSSSKTYPKKLYSEIGVYKLKGFQILVLDLYPIQFIPDTGDIYYYPELNVEIELSESNADNKMFRGKIQDFSEVIEKIDNPLDIEKYQLKQKMTSTDDYYDYLIITTETLKNSFIPLKNAHDMRGIKTEIKTLNDISLIPNNIEANDIRDYIRQEYLNHGIEYVLLGGDLDIIPAQFLYVFGMDEGVTPYETIMPCDFFFSCLDGPFNYDGDDRWGETNDGENGGDVDLYAEVNVGRASVGNTNEVDNFVTKTLGYLNCDYDDEYLDEYLFLGEKLGNYGEYSWGAIYLDQLIDGSSIDGYTTVGIPSDIFNIVKMYDRDGGWDVYDVYDYANNGLHVLNHDGHSNYKYNMRMTTDMVYNFNNDKYFFDYSNGCMSGGFDVDDCFAEYLNVKSSNGAFAVLMNARYGWFWAYSTDGDSTRFMREFWDSVFGEKNPIISKANQDSKEENIHIIDRSCIRWTFYELNLFGDPTIALKISPPPNKPTTPEGEGNGETNNEYTYTFSTTEPDNDEIYYLVDWGDGTNSGWLGPYNSGDTCEATNTWDKNGRFNVRVKAKDSLGMESEWSETKYVIMSSDNNGLWLIRGMFQYIEEDDNYIYIETNNAKITGLHNMQTEKIQENSNIAIQKPCIGILLKNTDTLPGIGLIRSWFYY